MIIPLAFLAVGAIFSGFLFKDLFIGTETSVNFWNNSIFFLQPLSQDHPPLWFIFLTPLLVVLSIPIAYYFFIKNKKITSEIVNGNLPLYNFLKNKWYFDELYNYLFVKPSKNIGLYFWKKVDLRFIDRFGPDGISNLIKNISLIAVKFQNGFIYHYAFIMLLGFSALLTFLILK
jgi:NADH-quinone oxidoreductase subunit L